MVTLLRKNDRVPCFIRKRTPKSRWLYFIWLTYHSGNPQSHTVPGHGMSHMEARCHGSTLPHSPKCNSRSQLFNSTNLVWNVRSRFVSVRFLQASCRSAGWGGLSIVLLRGDLSHEVRCLSAGSIFRIHWPGQRTLRPISPCPDEIECCALFSTYDTRGLGKIVPSILRALIRVQETGD